MCAVFHFKEVLSFAVISDLLPPAPLFIQTAASSETRAKPTCPRWQQAHEDQGGERMSTLVLMDLWGWRGCQNPERNRGPEWF